ncbi:MAG: hypothetical protein JWO62_743 [Acidimicrobiaceae bacterium]|jgi:hypothetical protein|nr:hypothetical protein [Acidimicrobiaceae bacterium]
MMDSRVLQSDERQGVGSGLSTESNARLTVNTGVVLFVLFAIEIVTVIIKPRSVLTLHVVVGLVLVPPLLVKLGSVGWRFLQYYRGDERYRAKGPPRPLLRVLGPLLLVATIVLLASGMVLLLSPSSFGGHLKSIHGASFYIWLLLVVTHVAFHWRDVRRLGTKDLARRSRQAVPGAVIRQTTVLISLVVGVLLSLSLVSQVGTYRHKAAYPTASRQAPAPAPRQVLPAAKW